MPRGRKKNGEPINTNPVVKEELPRIFFSDLHMGKCDKRQISLFGKRDTKDKDPDEEIIEDEPVNGEAGWYLIGYYGYYNLVGLFEAIKRDLLYRKIKEVKIVNGIDEFNELWKQNQAKFDKMFGLYKESVKVPKEVKDKINEVRKSIKNDSED